MAIVQNFWLRNSKKRLAGAVIYQAMGQTRQRSLASEVSNPRTIDQMSHRVKWSNLVNLYRANRSWMKYAFETKKESQSEYNKFMSLNVSNSHIYLPKQVANSGGCVLDNYIVTQGSLPSIEMNFNEDRWETNLYLPDSFSLVQTSTVGEVSRALFSANPALREGDQISLIIMAQQTNSTTGYPYVVIRKYEVILDSNSVSLWFNYMPFEYVGYNAGAGQNLIVVNADFWVGGLVMVLSRTTGGRTYVSTQSIHTHGIEAMISSYSSQAALDTAIQSYGESSDAFLSSNTAAEDSQAAISPSIIAVSINDTPVVIGSSVYPTNFDDETTIKVRFNQAMSGNTFSGKVYVHKNYTTTQINGVTVTRGDSSEFQMTLPEAAEDYAAWALEDIYISIDGTEYRAPFVVPNEATIAGLE